MSAQLVRVVADPTGSVTSMTEPIDLDTAPPPERSSPRWFWIAAIIAVAAAVSVAITSHVAAASSVTIGGGPITPAAASTPARVPAMHTFHFTPATAVSTSNGSDTTSLANGDTRTDATFVVITVLDGAKPASCEIDLDGKPVDQETDTTRAGYVDCTWSSS